MKKEKKSHGVQLLIRTVVRDPDGKVLSDSGQKPAKSFVIQFLEMLRYLFDAAAVALATNVVGGETQIYEDSSAVAAQLNIMGIINNDDWGTVVGTGDTAETNTDWKLETQLTEGAGVGNITHGVQVIGAVGVVGANVDCVATRAFTNNTGAAITVTEAGIYMYHRGLSYHCIVRDVLPASVNVPDRCSLAVIYTFRTTV